MSRPTAPSLRLHYRQEAFPPITLLRIAVFAVLLPLIFGCGDWNVDLRPSGSLRADYRSGDSERALLARHSGCGDPP